MFKSIPSKSSFSTWIHFLVLVLVAPKANIKAWQIGMEPRKWGPPQGYFLGVHVLLWVPCEPEGRKSCYPNKNRGLQLFLASTPVRIWMWAFRNRINRGGGGGGGEVPLNSQFLDFDPCGETISVANNKLGSFLFAHELKK